MNKMMQNSSQTRNTSIPSFFQNFCTGRGLEHHREKEISGSAIVQQRRPVVGGITCCVPQSFNNSLRNPELSYYVIPNGNSKEKKELQKRWLHLISSKDFHPGPGAHSGPKE